MVYRKEDAVISCSSPAWACLSGCSCLILLSLDAFTFLISVETLQSVFFFTLETAQRTRMEHKLQDGTISSDTIRAQEDRVLIEGHFPVFDTGAVDHKSPVCSSFIYSCQSRVCKCGNKEHGHLESEFGQLKAIYHKWNKKKMYGNLLGQYGPVAC